MTRLLLADSVWDGSPFLVQRGGSWFVRGIHWFTYARIADGPKIFVDLNDLTVREWLRDKMPPENCEQPIVPQVGSAERKYNVSILLQKSPGSAFLLV